MNDRDNENWQDAWDRHFRTLLYVGIFILMVLADIPMRWVMPVP